MKYLGNIAVGQTITFLFSSNDCDGAAVAPATAGTVCLYKDDGTSESAAGVTYTPSFDGLAGVNLVKIVTSDAFYAAGHDFTVVLGGAVIDGQTVNAVLATFSIANRCPTAESNADTLLDRANGIETGATLRQALRIMAAVLAGKVSGAGSGTESFKAIDGSTPRVQVVADASGNRTNVIYTPN
jgi:hypothetical protein